MLTISNICSILEPKQLEVDFKETTEVCNKRNKNYINLRVLIIKVLRYMKNYMLVNIYLKIKVYL